MSSLRLAAAAALAALLAALPARAHHGVAAVGLAGSEGPGAALETTSALPLPARSPYVLAKVEHVPFERRAVAEPENEDRSLFSTLALGHGIRPWLAAYVFQPFGQKVQDSLGTSAGLGDPALMLVLGFEWDEGLRLVPEKEGTILYAGGGLRCTVGAVSAAAGVRRAALKQLDEEARQQGSEGLETLRATFSLSAATGL